MSNNNNWLNIVDTRVVDPVKKIKRYPTAPIFTKEELKEFNNFETEEDVRHANEVLHDDLELVLRKIMYVEKMVNRNEYTAVQFDRVKCNVQLRNVEYIGEEQ